MNDQKIDLASRITEWKKVHFHALWNSETGGISFKCKSS